jgi:hypothetical protein
MSPDLVKRIKKMLPGVVAVEDYYNTGVQYPSCIRIRFKKGYLIFKEFRVNAWQPYDVWNFAYDTEENVYYKEYYWDLNQIPFKSDEVSALYKSRIKI